jgi:hypothetical protein
MENEKPLALVEDRFTEETILNAQISDIEGPGEALVKENVIYEISIDNSGLGENDTFSIRLLNPYDDAVVYGYKNGEWTQLESKQRGQYLQVQMTGTEEYFCIVNTKSNTVAVIVTAAVAAVILIILISLAKKNRLRRKQKKLNKQAKEENKE